MTKEQLLEDIYAVQDGLANYHFSDTIPKDAFMAFLTRLTKKVASLPDVTE